ncbi:hypothetical protein JTE90_022528 [Oedothorax gibbosus]|uniref:Uncharacterized protein n=1 Tax=Oedothorax gibbosus TaxID=931172 RepID=A0AAV6V1G8_9ARAC|nr:hypothetical protein JTE90_022528 [Oedothorax gibbosus]
MKRQGVLSGALAYPHFPRADLSDVAPSSAEGVVNLIKGIHHTNGKSKRARKSTTFKVSADKNFLEKFGNLFLILVRVVLSLRSFMLTSTDKFESIRLNFKHGNVRHGTNILSSYLCNNNFTLISRNTRPLRLASEDFSVKQPAMPPSNFGFSQQTA